ncbi:hypothetical protein AB0F42_15205 [Streptomyces buecherae]|uniref:hypothetical protein n=1 Tax=Streptomyces buecherae TaxID=2763006 RepID=UPI003407FF42
MQLSLWLILYLLLLPVVIWWYGVRARRLWRRFHSWASRLKLRFLAALQRQLSRLPAEPTEGEPKEAAPGTAPLRPRR